MGVIESLKDFEGKIFVRVGEERMDEYWLGSKGLRRLLREVDLKEVDDHIYCVNCSNLVHWASNVCENCLCDPRRKKSPERGQTVASNFLSEGNHPYKERRATPRIKTRKTFLHDGFLAKIQNISQGGIQMKTRTSLPVDKIVKMAFSLGDGIGRFAGSVVYAHSLSDADLLAGVKFAELSDRDSLLLRRFLDSSVTQKA